MKLRIIDLKNYYIDSVDPESTILKLALRTAFACTISILLLQAMGSVWLSAWAGFATFAFVQNDTEDLFFNRLQFLVVIILVFAAVTFLGMLLSNQSLIFLISVPLIIFLGAFPACLGFPYFNAGAWALFLYILAGATPVSFMQAAHVASTFLLCGIISVFACFCIFPIRPYRKIIVSYERILGKILLLFHHACQKNQSYFIQFSAQLDNMLALQEKNMLLYLTSVKLPPNKQATLTSLAKLLYQISLMIKSTLGWQRSIMMYSSYPSTHLEDCSVLMEKTLQALIAQIKGHQAPNFSALKTTFMRYRDGLTELRKLELAKANPDFSEFLDYATYFYHYLKLLELLEEVSKNITHLQGPA